MEHPAPTSRTGILCVVSGPSGSGKTTLCRKMVGLGGCSYSISCTTRPPREGEIDGEHYHFLMPEEFERRVGQGDLLEHAEVHGRRYGTLKSSVIEALEAGTDVLMDIDVQGAAQIRANRDAFIARSLVDVFILPPSTAELEDRLRGRGTEDEEEFNLRMRNAIAEMEHWPRYDYTIISGTPDEDIERFAAIVRAERMRSRRMGFGWLRADGLYSDGWGDQTVWR